MDILTVPFILLQILSYVLWIEASPLLPQNKDSIVLDYSNYNSFQPNGQGTYSFGYEIEDPDTQNIQFRDEERKADGTIIGSYGWVKPDGNIIMVRASVEGSEGESKRYGEIEPNDLDFPKENPILEHAIESLKYMNRPSTHEKHLRPIDQNFNFQEINSHNGESEYLYDPNFLLPKGYVEDYIEPKRIFFSY
ncbi:uncharacterized protein LOC114334953 isoform X2 [Diabrotica virgifera virgifera]|uniref:Uncharacterized protein n=1 Tax=Diabrotica virgifera virgifera TaxID=50390 RepID=A0ABM5KWL0_DIAVI|nr:uncharacterized protein LOC114334953 isoform X2 [Diabrotica virgifera virgifera]